MKAKKFITSIAKVTVVSGIAYLAYKLGESHGKEQEYQKHIEEYDDFEDDIYTEGEPYEPENSENRFQSLDSIHVENFPKEKLSRVFLTVCVKENISNKALRDELALDFDTAEKLLEAFEQAGYVSERNSHYVRKVYVTLADYTKLCR